MSVPTVPFDVQASSVSRYAIVCVLGVVAFLGLAIFVRSRLVERRRVHNRPQLVPWRRIYCLAGALGKRPPLLEVYLDPGRVGEYAWCQIMVRYLHSYAPAAYQAKPLSVQNIDAWPPSAKTVSNDLNPLASTVSRIAAIILMPCPSVPTHYPVGNTDEPIPHIEIGALDVVVRPATKERESMTTEE
ncbi:hypothetical protein B0H15DRAFT_949886 [Mycena belliarum]|uniref:Uncharacterized protein n=1 Tax=Mycena belliarum TaxID=1033014 RepID=A0AAD6XNY6_9AGAR|nr:hypothetical protein B0H15DRAFT_949886 [Mycena belliae]